MKIVKLSELLKKCGGNLRKALKARVETPMILLITAKEAQLLLGDALRNRQRREARVNDLMRKMHEGRWAADSNSLRGPPIAFDRQGRMGNGTTRLTAQVKAGVTLEHKVVLGVSRATLNDMDGSNKRDHVDRVVAFNDEAVIQDVMQGSIYRGMQLSQILNSFFVCFVGEKYPTLSDQVRMTAFYKEALTWTIGELGGDPAFRRTAVMSATVLAYQWAASHKQLEHFKSLVTKLIKGENISGTQLTLRDYVRSLLTTGGVKSKVKNSQWVVQMKCLRAYQAILSKEPTLSEIEYTSNSAELRKWFLGRTPSVHAKKLGVGCVRDVLNELRIRADGRNVLHLVKALEVVA